MTLRRLNAAELFFVNYTGDFRRSFAGEGLERERFGEHAMESYRAGVGFAHAKANLESLNRCPLFTAIPPDDMRASGSDSANHYRINLAHFCAAPLYYQHGMI